MKLRVLAFVNHVPLKYDPRAAIEQAIEWGVDYVVAQGTGKDWGPQWLGSGEQFPVQNFVENVRPYMRACAEFNLPFVLSAGIAGARPQLTECLTAFSAMCQEEGLNFNVAVIPGDVEPAYLLKRIAAGDEMHRMDDHPVLSEYLQAQDVEASTHIVAQIGPEPIMAALEQDVDGVITGRALDVGLFMAPALRAGASKATAALFGKLLECGGIALYPGDASMPIYGEIHDDDTIVVRSPDAKGECLVRSLAAHSFYERMDPFREGNPGGFLDLNRVTYEQVDSRTVAVRGAEWIPVPYAVKLEGAASLGYRAINVTGVRDPRYVAQMEAAAMRIKEEVRNAPRFSRHEEGTDYHLNFTIYGRDAVLGEAEHWQGGEHEVGVVIDVVAATEDLARDICFFASISHQAGPYPGRKTTAGNAAQRFTQMVNSLGQVYRWSIWHLMPLDDPSDYFQHHLMHFPSPEGIRPW